VGPVPDRFGLVIEKCKTDNTILGICISFSCGEGLAYMIIDCKLFMHVLFVHGTCYN
jgi:hypothetical protein